MRPLRIAVAVALLGLGAIALRPSNARHDDREARRLRQHFVIVERELDARDVSALSAEQRSARAELIRLLQRYAAEGRFPRNESLPGQMPFFRDSRGNLCAMAFLMAATGRGDIVDHVARTRNNAFVPELAGEPGLAGWLDRHGLTLAEAARIQPTYGNPPCCKAPPPQPRVPAISTGYAVATGTFGILSGFSLAWNARSQERVSSHRWRGLFGLGVGGVTLGLGMAKIDEDGFKNQGIGLWNIMLGATTAILGVRALVVPHPRGAGAPAWLQIAPLVATDKARFGFAGNFKF